MNCDEAFDCLTDPVRRRCDELTRHLDRCPRCRQMRDVLSPAIDLLASPTESAGFSAPSWTLDESGLDLERTSSRPVTMSAESFLLAERTAADLTRRSQNPRRLRRRFGSITRFAAILLLGAVITFSATAWSNRRANDRSTTSGMQPHDKCLWAHRADQGKSAPSRSSKQVVLSCVECHLGRPIE